LNILVFLICGFLISLLFPPYFLLPLGFIVFPYLCYYLENNCSSLSKSSLFISGFCLGFSFYLSALFWLKNPFFVFEETKNFFLIFLILIILLAIIFAIVLTTILNFNKILSITFILPLIFSINEFIVSKILYGFPWVIFSLVISNNDILLILIKNFGTFLTSFLIIQIFCLPYLFVRRTFIRFELTSFIIICVFPLFLIFFIHKNFLQVKNIQDKIINIEVFQMNFQNQMVVDDTSKRLEKITKSIKNSEADVLIFAENNYPYLIKNFEFTEIKSVLREHQTVVIGGTRIENNNAYNTLFNIQKSDISYYDKKILVPFGEFLPFRNILSFFEKISGSKDFSIGKEKRLININNDLNYIPVICYEIIFYWKIINQFNYKSDFIINITNDSWFGTLIGPYQHLYLTKLRSIEFSKPIIRVSNNGISSIIDSNSNLIKATKLNEKNNLNLNLNIKKEKNFYRSHVYINRYFFIILFFLLIINLIKTYEKRNIQK